MHDHNVLICDSCGCVIFFAWQIHYTCQICQGPSIHAAHLANNGGLRLNTLICGSFIVVIHTCDKSHIYNIIYLILFAMPVTNAVYITNVGKLCQHNIKTMHYFFMTESLLKFQKEHCSVWKLLIIGFEISKQYVWSVHIVMTILWQM